MSRARDPDRPPRRVRPCAWGGCEKPSTDTTQYPAHCHEHATILHHAGVPTSAPEDMFIIDGRALGRLVAVAYGRQGDSAAAYAAGRAIFLEFGGKRDREAFEHFLVNSLATNGGES